MRAVIFDMDGVIFDTEHMVIECWNIVSERHGFARVDEVYQTCFGCNYETIRSRFLDYYGAGFPYDAYKEECRELFFAKAKNGLPMKKGTLEILEFLKEKGYLIGLATSTRESVVTMELHDAGIYDYFDRITCGDMVSRSKPEPDIYLKACRDLGIAPEEAWAVEDSFNGIRSAFRAGLHPIMVPDMVQPDQEMRELSDCILEDLLQVKEYLAD